MSKIKDFAHLIWLMIAFLIFAFWLTWGMNWYERITGKKAPNPK